MLFPKKILALFLAITLNWGLFFAIGDTFAYFNDTEQSNGQLTAGILDLTISGDTGFNASITPNAPITRQISILNNGTLDFNYSFKLNNFSGDEEFCNQLNSKISLNGTETYSGPIGLFSSTTSALALAAFATSNLELSVSLNSEELGLWNKTCNFDIDFTAWQDNLASSSQGFFDTETINNTISSGVWGVVLNEFLPNPAGFEYGFDFGEDEDLMPKGEWVELYNNDNFSHDLTGWYIQDAANHRVYITTTNTNLSTTTIASHNFLVVYMNQAILNNSGTETVFLFDTNSNVKDFYTYSNSDYCNLEPTPSNSNNTTPSGSCGGAPGNKSYARIPDGIGNWVDPIPTPGFSNSNILEDTIVPKTENLLLQENVFLIPTPALNIDIPKEQEENNQPPIEITNNNTVNSSSSQSAPVEEMSPEPQEITEPEPKAIVLEENTKEEQPSLLPAIEEQPAQQEQAPQPETTIQENQPAIELEAQVIIPEETTNSETQNNE